MNVVYPPHLGVNDTSCRIISWAVDDESYVEAGAVICEVETTKAVFDVEATHAGFLRQLATLDEELSIDNPVAVILNSVDEEFKLEDKEDDNSLKEFESLNCTKKAYEYSIIHNINISVIQKGSIITLNDVKQFQQDGNQDESIVQINSYSNRYKKKQIAIYGTGLGAETAYYHSQINSRYHVKFFINDFDKSTIHGINSVTFDELLANLEGLYGVACFVADNSFRLEVIDKLKETNLISISLISKNSTIAASAVIGQGVFIKDGVVIGNDCIIGDGVVIDDNSTVPHHCIIEDGAFLAPGCSLGGGCIVRSKAVIGVGASVASNLIVGENTIVSSGAALLTNTDANVVIQGNPAVVIGKKIK
ncbi:hypothetical protein N9357_02755 [bacterium]|nr:hypothetical protein [bacterium]